METFLKELSSKEPVPGGGGASALVGAIGCALCSMVGNLTTGKKKYAEYQGRLDELLPWLESHREVLLADIKKDADAFYPLSQAYSLDKNDPATEGIMEKALKDAAEAPLQIVKDVYVLVPILEELADNGSRLAISDVAVAADACHAALRGAVMNIYINTKSMKNRELAEQMNKEAKQMVTDGCKRCDAVYEKIAAGMEK